MNRLHTLRSRTLASYLTIPPNFSIIVELGESSRVESDTSKLRYGYGGLLFA